MGSRSIPRLFSEYSVDLPPPLRSPSSDTRCVSVYAHQGWVFGERESQFTVAGFVPSIKKEGVIKAGGEQLKAAAIMQDKAHQRDAEKVRHTHC
jgi:hypothetical protein